MTQKVKIIKKVFNEKQTAARQTRRQNVPDFAEMRIELAEKDKSRFALVTERKKAVDEEIHTRQEITRLKQGDVKDNQAREGNLHLLYKQQLAGKIVEKRERAANVKEQQARIAQMCRSQRLSYEKAFAAISDEQEAAKGGIKSILSPRV